MSSKSSLDKALATLWLATTSLLLLAVGPALAQRTEGSLTGRVVDEDGAPIPYVNVLVRGPALQGTDGAMSLREGSFLVPNLPLGIYEVEIRHVSYRPVTITGVRIHLGRASDLGDLALEATTYVMPAISITAPALQTDPVHTTVSTNITREEFERLPMGRGMKDALLMTPFANESFSSEIDRVNVAGSTGPDTSYFIDGMNATEAATGGMEMHVPWNFLEEAQVVGGGYQPEFGRSTGGIVNLVTRRGSNEFEGSAFVFGTADPLRSSTKQGIGESTGDDVTEYDVGFTVGGPIVRDRLWFFAGYDRERRHEDLDLLGLSTERVVGHRDSYLGAINWAATDRTEVDFTIFANAERFDTATPFGFIPTSVANTDCLVKRTTRDPLSLQLGLLHRFAERTSLEAQVAYTRLGFWFGGAAERGREEPMFFDRSTGEMSGGYPTGTDDPTRRIAARIHGALGWGSHRLKTGVEYEQNRSDGESWMDFIYTRDGGYERTISETYNDSRNQFLSAFLQDSWRLGDRLNLSGGLRWDAQYIGNHDEVAMSILDQWQPRAGIVYRIPGPQTLRLFGSYGRYYRQSTNAEPLATVRPGSSRQVYYSEDPRLETSTPDSTVHNLFLDPSLRFVDRDAIGEHFDEWTLGTEWHVGPSNRLALRGMYRELKQTLVPLYDVQSGAYYFGNPGKGPLAHIAPYEHTYAGVEITWERKLPDGIHAALSYIRSRNRGNYPGMYEAELQNFANSGGNFISEAWASVGPLSNDRPHVWKLRASQALDFGLTWGAFFTWQSGTPLNEIIDNWYTIEFVGGRGGAGRMPSIWDLSVRTTYDVGLPLRGLQTGRLVVDVLHIGNPREEVLRDPTRGWLSEGELIENPGYGRATAYQPPMMVRLGWEVMF